MFEMIDLYKKFDGWVDNSMYEGLDDDEYDEMEQKMLDKYGTKIILRPDAPPEAVEAFEECNRIRNEAAEQGCIID